MISVTAHVNVEKLAAFTPFANARLRDLVDEVRREGEVYMSSRVPHGQTNRLAAAVTSSIFSVTDAHHIGSVGVDQRIAPYADKVDKGSGVDGPFHSPVRVYGPARSVIGPLRKGGSRGGQGHVMRFQKNGEPPKFRRVVKATPSLKIMRGKGFSDDTYRTMRIASGIKTGVLAHELTLYFSDRSI